MYKLISTYPKHIQRGILKYVEKCSMNERFCVEELGCDGG